ncbi:DNA-binding MarR family transcriptional regulator [Oikeobacillus pervagus]|uniref:DNA-binding MarR family transcriptional regulator n=1 Tax=Oikeobacillus pervagus TaxID=1325931 RepID=A0AAJ1T537_9BACI|nr:MarR family transcriptional regulator [Oikeobacillus pervagus]MDQ0216776.1 DNA-binding MarR family transcriptional regulator [Oikeobacillus pervagus]
MEHLHTFFHQIQQTSRYLTKIINENLAPHGIYSAQWTVIYSIHQNGSCTQSELCQYLNVEAPTMTRTLKRMEQLGWIHRVPGQDKREKWIQLTPAALEKYPQWKKAVQEMEQQLAKKLTIEEQKLILQSLMHLTKD